jgi:hypothetical protein
VEQWSDPEVTDQVAAFYTGLSEADADLFDAAIDRLISAGPTLGRPTAGEVDLTRESAELRELFGNKLKELRAGTIRVLFLFGPDRVPILLYAGDKQGDWSRWYPPAIKEAARLYRAYLEEL